MAGPTASIATESMALAKPVGIVLSTWTTPIGANPSSFFHPNVLCLDRRRSAHFKPAPRTDIDLRKLMLRVPRQCQSMVDLQVAILSVGVHKHRGTLLPIAP